MKKSKTISLEYKEDYMMNIRHLIFFLLKKLDYCLNLEALSLKAFLEILCQIIGLAQENTQNTEKLNGKSVKEENN